MKFPVTDLFCPFHKSQIRRQLMFQGRILLSDFAYILDDSPRKNLEIWPVNARVRRTLHRITDPASGDLGPRRSMTLRLVPTELLHNCVIIRADLNVHLEKYHQLINHFISRRFTIDVAENGSSRERGSDQVEMMMAD